MVRKLLLALGVVYVVGAAVWVVQAGFVRDPNHDANRVELLNVACDPTRELWQELNAHFIDRYAEQTGIKITIRQSHGGSGSQARAICEGLQADVATLALWNDTDAIRKAGLINPGWDTPASLPYVSTIVMVVRQGNPKNIRDWDDLDRPDVQVITPHPKTSGNGKWAFLALWGFVTVGQQRSEADAQAFVANVYRRVPVLDAAARSATMTFAKNKIGDVHLTWENEAFLEVEEAHGQLEIVYPSISVLAEPHVAPVDRVVDAKGTRRHVEAYLRFLHTLEAQEIMAKHYYRPTNAIVQQRTAGRFHTFAKGLFPVRQIGTWDQIQQRFFAQGGVFDQIYAKGSQP